MAYGQRGPKRKQMFKRLYDWTLALAGTPHATFALGVISFIESSVFPIPADVLFIPMAAARPERAWRLALIASVTSVLGGIFGWIVGHYGAEVIVRPIMDFYGEAAKFDALHAYVNGNSWIILLLLVTSGLAHLPPMKVVTILSGVVGFSLPLFILSAILARGARFYGLAWLLRRYGPQILHFIETRLVWVAGVIVALAVLVWAYLRFHAS